MKNERKLVNHLINDGFASVLMWYWLICRFSLILKVNEFIWIFLRNWKSLTAFLSRRHPNVAYCIVFGQRWPYQFVMKLNRLISNIIAFTLSVIKCLYLTASNAVISENLWMRSYFIDSPQFLSHSAPMNAILNVQHYYFSLCWITTSMTSLDAFTLLSASKVGKGIHFKRH